MSDLEDSWILTSAFNLLKYILWVEVYKENPVSLYLEKAGLYLLKGLRDA